MSLKDPKCKRFIRQYEDFSICVNIGEKDYVLAEHPNERFTTHYYSVYGSGKFGEIFSSEHLLIQSGKLYDVEKYVREKVIFEALEDFYLIGFNTNNKDEKWDGKIIKNLDSQTISVEKKSIIINFSGLFQISGKEFKKYDYTELIPEKDYSITTKENTVIALFWKI